MFDELYPEAADLALKTKINRPPTAPKAPEFSTWGMFRGIGTGLPAGAAQGIASTGEMLGAFGTTLATTGGSAGGMFQLPTEAEQKQSLEATDKLIKGDELFAGGEVTRSFRNAAEGYKPDPTTTHTAEQVVFNFARVGGKAITAAMTMGNVPGAIVAGAEEGFTQAEELKQQGVDIGTRTKVGAVTAVTNAVGFALPVAGKTWLQTAGLVAVGGPGTFVTQQAATKAILENANYADLAKQYDPTDTLGLAMSTLLPLGFGALAMRVAKAKPGVEDKGPMPDGTSPAIKAPATADTAQPATKGIANVQDAQAPAGTKAQATPDQAGTNAEGNATPPTDVPGTGAADVQANGVAPKQGPGAPLANGFFAGPVEGEKFRVSDVSATGGLTLDKRLKAGTVSTMYVGVDGGFIDAGNVNLIGDGASKIWKPITDAARNAAREILQEMGTLPLGNKRREELKAKLKEVVANDGTPPPDASPAPQTVAQKFRGMTEDEYIAAITQGKAPREFNDPMPQDAFDSLPNTGESAGSFKAKDGTNIELVKGSGDYNGAILAVADGKTVGYMAPEAGTTGLFVSDDFRGKGIGEALSTAYRTENPMAPSGGFSAAGEAIARKVFRKLADSEIPAPKMAPPDDLVDAARVSLVRQHMDAANPMPDNVETAGAHNAAYSQALDQVAAGERVAVDVPEVVAAKAAEEIGARIDAAKQADFVEVVAKPNSDFVQAKSDAGLVGGHVRDGALHITTAEVDPAYRGQGEGIKLYTALVDDALAKGQRVFSDSTVEASAVRMYEALQRRGYEVKRLEGGSLEDGAAYGKGAKEPAFEVVGKTEPKPAPALADTAQAATKPQPKSDPPVYSDTRGGPDRFHGTGKPIPALSDYYALAGDSRNIYGQGFYTTDAVDISAGYMRKGGKNSTLYKVTESDVKMYDMEAPITPEMEGILKSAMGDSYPTANYESGAPLKNLRDVYDEYRRQSRYEGLSRDDVQEVFDSIRANLEAQGYRGFSHVGGALTGKQAHAVKIFWFPESDVQIKPVSIADYVQNKPQALADTAQAATKTVADQTPDLATFMTAKGLDAPAAPVEPKAANGNAFIAWLKDAGGVAWSQKTDIVGERGVRGNYAGIFTKKGQNLDTLVESAVQAGYLTRADLEASGDVGGTRALSELIRRATTGEKIATVENADAARIAQGQARAAMDAVDAMERELRALGVDPSAARGNADALGTYLAEHRTALINKKLAEIDAETKAERIATGEAYNLSPKQIDAQTRITLAGELDENAMHQAAMVARDEVDFLNRVEEIINNAPGSRKTIQSSQGSAADASIPARDGQAAADATTSASGFNPAALAADAARFLEGGKSAAQVIGEMEVSGAKASPEMQNMLIGVAEFGGRINELADQVSALKAQRGAGTKPFELVAQAVENMRTGTKVEAPKPKTPTEARFADLQARNPDVMDKPMQFDVDENGNAAGPATTAREYLERIQREADQDTADASLIEVAANCFLSGGM